MGGASARAVAQARKECQSRREECQSITELGGRRGFLASARKPLIIAFLAYISSW